MARKQLTTRKRGAPKVGTALVRQVINKCRGQSVLSGESDWKRLCVVRVDARSPWTLENTVLVTSAESYALTCLHNEERRTSTLRNWIKNSQEE